MASKLSSIMDGPYGSSIGSTCTISSGLIDCVLQQTNHELLQNVILDNWIKHNKHMSIFTFLVAPPGTPHGATIIISNSTFDVKLTNDNP